MRVWFGPGLGPLLSEVGADPAEGPRILRVVLRGHRVPAPSKGSPGWKPQPTTKGAPDRTALEGPGMLCFGLWSAQDGRCGIRRRFKGFRGRNHAVSSGIRPKSSAGIEKIQAKPVRFGSCETDWTLHGRSREGLSRTPFF